MDAREVFDLLVDGLINAGVPIDEEELFVDPGSDCISVYWYGGSSHFWSKMTRPDMLNHIKSSIQNHLRFHLRRLETQQKQNGIAAVA